MIYKQTKKNLSLYTAVVVALLTLNGCNHQQHCTKTKKYIGAKIAGTKNNKNIFKLNFKNVMEFDEHEDNIRLVKDKDVNRMFKEKKYKIIAPMGSTWFIKEVPLQYNPKKAELYFCSNQIDPELSKLEKDKPIFIILIDKSVKNNKTIDLLFSIKSAKVKNSTDENILIINAKDKNMKSWILKEKFNNKNPEKIQDKNAMKLIKCIQDKNIAASLVWIQTDNDKAGTIFPIVLQSCNRIDDNNILEMKLMNGADDDTANKFKKLNQDGNKITSLHCFADGWDPLGPGEPVPY